MKRRNGDVFQAGRPSPPSRGRGLKRPLKGSRSARLRRPLHGGSRKRGRESYVPPLPFLSFLGRPLGRSDDSRPRRMAICVCHSGRPKGEPRRTHCRRTSNSSWLSDRFAAATQLRGGATGQAVGGNSRGLVPTAGFCRLCHRLHHRQASDTRPSRKRLPTPFPPFSPSTPFPPSCQSLPTLFLSPFSAFLIRVH